MSLDDERVRFYLRHRAELETWATLRPQAAAAVDEWLAGLENEIRSAVGTWPGAPLLTARTGTDEPWPKFMLTKPSWPAAEDRDAQVAVCLEWKRGGTILHGDLAPYVGLRGHGSQPAAALVRAKPPTPKRKYLASPWWIGYRYVMPEAAFPEHAERYTEQLVGAFREAWDDYAAPVDAAVLR